MTPNRVLALMVAAMVLGYMPWYNFSAVFPVIRHEYAISAGQAGFILAAFQLGYVVVVLFTGWLADRLGPKRLVVLGTLGTGAFSTAFALWADSFESIVALRVLTGMAAGAIYAPGMALLSNWFITGRGNALGAYTAALTAAYAGGYFVAAPVAAAEGWRAGVLWSSLPAFLGVLALLPIREQPAAPVAAAAAPSALAPAGGGDGVVSPRTAALNGAYMGHMWELYAFWGWVGPAMAAAATASGMATTEATALGGQMAALAVLAGAPGPWLLGAVADRWGRARTAALCLALSGASSLTIGWLLAAPLWLVGAVAVWYGFWAIADSAIYKAELADLVAVRVRATSLGVQSALGFGVSMLSPQLFGLVLERTSGGSVTGQWGPAFAMLAAGPLAGIVLLRVLRALRRGPHRAPQVDTPQATP